MFNSKLSVFTIQRNDINKQAIGNGAKAMKWMETGPAQLGLQWSVFTR